MVGAPFRLPLAAMRDLNSHRSMKMKAALFAGIGLLSAWLLWISVPTFKSAVLLILCVWAFCRLYYFAFYVIEKYIDPAFKFSGVLDALRYLLKSKDKQQPSPPTRPSQKSS
jgi:hypothetical protein